MGRGNRGVAGSSAVTLTAEPVAAACGAASRGSAAPLLWDGGCKVGHVRCFDGEGVHPTYSHCAPGDRSQQGRAPHAAATPAAAPLLQAGGWWACCAREEGSPDDHLAASLKVEPVLEEAAAAATAAADAGAAAVAKAAAQSAPKLSKEEMLAMRREQDPNFGKKHKAAKVG
eukprot:366203-Chlamydomonas_euryale.AAC.2